MGGLLNSPANLTPQSGGTLDSPPPSPPQAKRKNLMDMVGATPKDEGLGQAAANPQVMTLAATQAIRNASEILSALYPQLAPPLQAFVAQLEQIVPQVMAQESAYGGTASPGSPTGPPQMGAPPMPTGAPTPGGAAM